MGPQTRTPATLARTSRRPKRSAVSRTARAASGSWARSAPRASTRAPVGSMRPAASLAAPASLSTTATPAPSSQHRRAVASPIPPPPPVTRATFPRRRPP